MFSLKNKLKTSLMAALSLTILSCSDSENNSPTPAPIDGDKTYVLGLGVTASTATTNYVLKVSNLMSGKISLTGQGILQEGYRDFAFANSTFYSIGGLGVTDVNAITLGSDGKLVTKTGLTFELPNNNLVDVDGSGKTLIGVSVPSARTVDDKVKFYLLNTATNTINSRAETAVNDLYPTANDWIFHSGIQVSGAHIYQTFYPASDVDFKTKDTDKAYVAVYSYPGMALEKVITDERTGPAGAFNTQSGIFKTEAGDLYTISTTSFANGYSQSTKDAAVLKIKAGTTEFDQDYYFNTDNATNGGKIAHAIYIGNGKLFAAVTQVKPTIADLWKDNNLRLAIVDLNAKTITPVKNAPVFSGDGGRSFAALLDEGKVYSSIIENGQLFIYQTDVATATATKGAQIEASFLGGIARLK